MEDERRGPPSLLHLTLLDIIPISVPKQASQASLRAKMEDKRRAPLSLLYLILTRVLANNSIII